MISIRDADQCSSGVVLSRRVPKLIGLGVFLRSALFRSVVKQNMGPKAQIASVIGVALAFGLFIQCVTFALDQSFVAKRTTEFQESQLAAVDQVAQRVRWQFQKLNDALHSLSQIPDVQFVQANEALLHLIRAYRMNAEMVEGIFRLDKSGVLQLAYPENASLPPSDALRRILEQARRTGDTSYQVIHRQWDGTDVLVIAKPVYTVQGEVQLHPSNKFAGLLLFAVSLNRLNRDILDLPTFGRSGFFWVITDEGVIVGAELGSLLGKPVAELSSRFPRKAKDAFQRMIDRMRHGASGNEEYSHPLGPYLPDLIMNEYSRTLPLAPRTPDSFPPETWQTRLIAFTSLMLGANHWSIAVVSPKDDVTLLIDKMVGDRWLITAAFVLTIVVMTSLIVVIIRKTHVSKLAAIERTAQQLRDSKKRLANAQRIAKVGHWSYDPRSKTTSISDSMYLLLGLPRGGTRLAHQDFFRMLQPAARTEIRKVIFRALKARTGCTFEHWIVWQDGANRFIHQEIEVESDADGTISQIAGIAQDITEHRTAQQRIRDLAYFDPVTGLPNRSFLKEFMAISIDGAKRNRRTLAVLFLDLDNFKCINDTLGHEAGDVLLRGVSERLVDCVRRSDCTSHFTSEQKEVAPVTRLGGDEFVIVLTEIKCAENAAKVAQRVAEALSLPIAVAVNEITVSASIGIAVFPTDGEDTETLLKNADAAMYHAKSQGRNGYAFYTRPLHDRALKRLSLEGSLRKALKREEFLLHLQPRLDVAQQRVVAAEALIRWRHPEDGVIPPSEFIPIAEETGLILSIGEWVIREACRHAASWQAAGWPDMRVSVNLSAVQFKQRGFVKCIEAILRETELSPQSLELELTESLLMADTQANVLTLRELTELGVNVSIDDFGTGYSSLSYLKQFPLTALKIDKSFVRDIPYDADDVAIVRATIALAHSLRLRAIAEGVENQAQLDFLTASRCDEIQGYLIGRPMSAARLKEWLSENGAERDLMHDSPRESRTRGNNLVVLHPGRFGAAGNAG